jgi:hypothetical protein
MSSIVSSEIARSIPATHIAAAQIKLQRGRANAILAAIHQ